MGSDFRPPPDRLNPRGANGLSRELEQQFRLAGRTCQERRSDNAQLFCPIEKVDAAVHVIERR